MLKTYWTMSVFIYICSNQISKKPQNKNKKEKNLLGSVGSHECKYKHVRGNSTVNFIFSAQITSLKCISLLQTAQTICLLMCPMGPQVLERERKGRMYAGRGHIENVQEPLVFNVIEYFCISSVNRHPYTVPFSQYCSRTMKFTGHRSSLNKFEH